MTDNTRVLEKIEDNENSEKGEINMCQAWDEIMEECRAEGMEQGIERGIKQGIERGIEQGIERGIEQGIEQGIVSSIRSLKENLKMTTEQAMKTLDIPENMFVHYLQLV